jgi:hypothetical protein
MMLPARGFPEEDPRRTGLQGTAGTPAEALADPGRGTDTGKAALPDTEVQVGKTARADTGMSADNGVQASNGIPDDNAVPTDTSNGVPDENAVPTDNGMQAGKAAQADAEVVTHDPQSATPASAVEAGSPVGAHTAVNADAPATALSPARGDSVDAAAGREWSEVLAMFVDDPRGSVTEASAIVDEAINAFIAAARARQASLAASWQAQDSDTEQLRMAVQHYRTFWTSMTQLPQSA